MVCVFDLILDMNPKVMVVDDEPDIALVTGHLLKMEGIEADYFTDADTAFIHFLKHPNQYSAIVSDIRMPDINGIDLANAIHDFDADVPIVFMTAYDIHSEDLPSFIDKENIVKKPFLGRLLCQRVVQLLRAKSDHRLKVQSAG